MASRFSSSVAADMGLSKSEFEDAVNLEKLYFLANKEDKCALCGRGGVSAVDIHRYEFLCSGCNAGKSSVKKIGADRFSTFEVSKLQNKFGSDTLPPPSRQTRRPASPPPRNGSRRRRHASRRRPSVIPSSSESPSSDESPPHINRSGSRSAARRHTNATLSHNTFDDGFASWGGSGNGGWGSASQNGDTNLGNMSMLGVAGMTPTNHGQQPGIGMQMTGMQQQPGMGGMQQQPGMGGMQQQPGMGSMQQQPGMGGMQQQPCMGGIQQQSGIGGVHQPPGMGGLGSPSFTMGGQQRWQGQPQGSSGQQPILGGIQQQPGMFGMQPGIGGAMGMPSHTGVMGTQLMQQHNPMMQQHPSMMQQRHNPFANMNTQGMQLQGQGRPLARPPSNPFSVMQSYGGGGGMVGLQQGCGGMGPMSVQPQSQQSMFQQPMNNSSRPLGVPAGGATNPFLNYGAQSILPGASNSGSAYASNPFRPSIW